MEDEDDESDESDDAAPFDRFVELSICWQLTCLTMVLLKLVLVHLITSEFAVITFFNSKCLDQIHSIRIICKI